jgi:hypothetical protein
MKKTFSTLVTLSTLSFSGGAEGKNQGDIYTQLSYSPIATQTYANQAHEIVEGPYLTRHQIQNYGELGIYNYSTAFVWNLNFTSQDIAGKTTTGLGSSSFGLQHQYLNSKVQLGIGVATELPSPSGSESKLSNPNVVNSISNFVKYYENRIGLHLLQEDKDLAIAYDYSYTWNPSSGLYLKGVLRGQHNLHAEKQDSSQLGYSLQTEFISPGMEVFYSLNQNWHILGAFYTGPRMKNLYAFPGLKFGFAWTN